jgi:hypothetical protein
MTFKLFDKKYKEPTIMVGVSLIAVFLAGCVAIFSGNTSDKIRARIVSIAYKEPRDNPRVSEYWKDTLIDYKGSYPSNWCGVFILWVLHRAKIALDIKWIIEKGFLYRLPTTKNPKPGDVAYFNKNQHQALVHSVIGNKVNLINGNGLYGKITLSSNVNMSDVTAFYDIEPFIQKVLT